MIGAISYSGAVLAFVCLGAWLLFWLPRSRVNAALLVACLGSVAWGVASVWYSPGLLRPPVESLRNTLWFVFLLQLLQGSATETNRPRRMPLAVLSYSGAVFLLQVALYLGVLPMLPLYGLFAGATANVVQAVIGMVLVEQFYRNTTPDQRWGIKFLCLGLVGIFVYDFYMYAEGLLFHRVDRSVYEARGLVNALAAPLIAISVSRNPRWLLRFTVSRRALFHSASLLATGIYLLMMAGAGYYIRYFGGSWGGVFQVAFFFGAGIVLATALFSGTLRAYLKVFLSKHFFAYRYDYREEWLRFTRTLSEGEPGLHLRERSILAMAALIESPGGALWLRGEKNTFEVVAHWNMREAAGSESIDSPFCLFIESKEWVVDLDEFESFPESYGGLAALPAWLLAIGSAKLVVPLILHERLIGWILLARSRGGLQLNWEVNDLLKTAGRQAASYLAQVEAAQALLVARQFESFNRMSAFVVHDLKNVVAQLSLMLSNAAKHKHNPAFQDDMLETVGFAIDKMNRLLMQLRKGAQPIDKPEQMELADILQRVVSSKAVATPAPEIVSSKKGLCIQADADRLERVVGHLVQNAVDATPASGFVHIDLEQVGNMACITVRDNGQGMSEQFMRDRLFRPFESTKAMGMGIGTYESREYVRQLGGDIEVVSGEGRGTTFVVKLPLAKCLGEPNS